ncbi:MAG: Zn-dependent exopeptidase M28 [Deltaproteobacteria bacterium]|nr:MAG: Zn-dependent exopeptidase M28 [Deltaproteobacteria bacterium]
MVAVKMPRKSVLTAFLATLFWMLFITAAAGQAGEPPSSLQSQVLARVEVPGLLQDLNLPVYADLTDAAGKYYALVIAPRTRLETAGVSFQTLDAYSPGTRYLLALARRPGARRNAAASVKILHDDGRRILVRYAPGLDELLADLGFALRLLGEKPMTLAIPTLRPRVLEFLLTPDPGVSSMIAAVTQETVNSYISGLSGETPVMVEGSAYTITNRHTRSGTPLEKASRYVFEQLQGAGLNTSLHPWTYASYANRNVVGELTGAKLPDEIVLLTAHLDDLPLNGLAPGADDNASGCAALLTAAGIMGRHRFQRTIRFVFFTGEEQGLLGSERYAEAVAGENIVAVLNLDMIGYDSANGPTQRLHTRKPANPGYQADLEIAATFQEVVNTYGLAGSLQPIITAEGESESDHSSFWDRGFAAVFAIEDDWDDFNPDYHSSGDKLQNLNLPYCTAQVKATVGTVAHLAGPIATAVSPTPTPWQILLLSRQRPADTFHGPPNFLVN